MDDASNSSSDLKDLMRKHYIEYASYVILDRAIPHVADGLKPVQRRILQTLFRSNDGKLHKVANIVGQTMQLHPHGDAPIYDALVNLANKDFLLDRQGNFGNLYTGDPASAARYIETRLSPLAVETLFNPDITDFIPSYDGRSQEPVVLPSKIPLLLMQGADGIAVGMATRILPHNFVELLEAQIKLLEGEAIQLYPDFPTGGIMDASEYDKGRGKVKVRAKVCIMDDKTIIIEEICPGTTTESLIRSVDEAAKKGKIRIDSISDYTAEKVEIEIKLPRGQHAQQLLDALYAYTECEVSINSQPIVIRDNLPWETTVDEILQDNTARLQEYLRRELEIERDRLQALIYPRTLERIFIENKIYKKIETVGELSQIHDTVAKAFVPFHKELGEKPTQEDRDFLLGLPIRRISRFDIEKNQEEIAKAEDTLAQVLRDLKAIKRVTIRYLKHLIDKYGKEHPRRTRLREIEELDRRSLETREVKVFVDAKKGFIGTKVSADSYLECTNFDKILLMYQDGTYRVINVPEKQYVCHEGAKIAYVGIADKTTTLSVVYRNPKTAHSYAKRFIVDKFIVDRPYRYFEEEMKLDYITSNPNVEVELSYKPKPKLKVKSQRFALNEVGLKKVSAKGIRLSTKEVKGVKAIVKESAK
ncbi:MAG: DNA topoisomerase IV subunit A [Chlamydiia bacterium]|nr:DNA topoisomerase IV subunit A [Chlamydiia bacterium]